jgi:gamma-D-glutamyl-L-lysine dipeptidyl-peptidase
MNKFLILSLNIYFLLTIIACAPVQSDEPADEIDAVIADIKAQYAPDKRVAVFNIESAQQAGQLILRGETDLPQAKKALLEELVSISENIVDSVLLLPDMSVLSDSLGVVSISVANIRSEPGHSAELATQATMGMPLRLLKKQGEWHLVQTPDKYISWMQGSFQPMSAAAFEAWKNADKLIYTHIYGFAYKDAVFGETLSDLVAGNIMELVKEMPSAYEVRFPDGRKAFVKKTEAAPFSQWLAKAEATENTLVNTAFKLLGVPYLWGGTSTKGIDCSGFTKTIYFMNGFMLPRDASQQVHAGTLIDENKNFENLQPGDLLFFGRHATDSTRERVTHVGMWIGNKEFIHAPGLEAHVRVSSVDEAAENFDEFNLNRYLRTKRMISSTNEIIDLKEVALF